MSQGLHLSQRMSQQMVLSPQLQHSLALLQAPALELKALVEQELQVNPVLEELQPSGADASESEGGGAEEAEAADPAEPPADVRYDPATEKPAPESPDGFEAELKRLLQLDQDWRDHFAQAGSVNRRTPEDEEHRQFMFESLEAGVSLQQHLLDQLRLSEMTEAQRPVAEMIIGNIDDRGYLQSGVSELSFSTGIAEAEIEAVLKVVQTLEPAGVGARDLRECLLLQLERLGRTSSLEYGIIRDHFDALARRRLPDLARVMGADIGEIQDAAGRIAMLDPHPGGEFSVVPETYVTPEVTVAKNGDEWQVQVEGQMVPRLRISNHYKDLLSQTGTSGEVREYIREKIRAGKFLIKSIHQRQDTILRISQEIVKRQREFFDHGVSHLKPMTMVQVAETVGVHETTVSRAVSGKYMATPGGVYELKYFFTSGVQTASGESVSNTSVKSTIAELFRDEDRMSPISDEGIVAKLKERGIVVARRTVAKYRAELGILPSHLRKEY